MNLRFVLSAPGMCRLIPVGDRDRECDLFTQAVDLITKGVDKLQEDCTRIIGHEFKTDILFNAYTEKGFLKSMKDYDKFGFDKLYADSGGLQIVTRSMKEIDQAQKRKIYEVQSEADYAMCFDEIPVRTVVQSSSSRTQVGDKIFYPSKIKESSLKTAQNIKEQIEVLDELGSSSKVHYIIQGNRESDMVDWFNIGSSVLDDEHFKSVGGVSLADTCMGNGPLESIEMLSTYSTLVNSFDTDKIKKHLHLLGVGGASRLKPLIYLIQSGFLPNEGYTYSFDSSTMSLSFIQGNFRTENNSLINSNDLQSVRYSMESVFSYYENIFRESGIDFDVDEIIDIVMKHIRSVSDLTSNTPDRLYPIIRAFIPLYNSYGIKILVQSLKKQVSSMKFDKTPIGMLQYVKNGDDYKKWFREFSHLVPSKRIYREKEFDLSNFFG